MSRACGAARREVLTASGPRDYAQQLATAQAHLRQCASCRAFMDDMSAISGATRGLGGESAPTDVRERLFASVATARTGTRLHRPSRSAWLLPGAVAAAAVIAVLGIGRLRDAPSTLVSTLTQEHASAVSGDRLESDDVAELQRWLAARLPFAVFVPVLEGAELTGARISLTPNGRGAVVEYGVGGESVSYFILPPHTDGNPEPGRLRHAHASGYRAVMWSEMGLLHAMVGAVSQEMLERLARDCIRQAPGAAGVAVAPLPHMSGGRTGGVSSFISEV